MCALMILEVFSNLHDSMITHSEPVASVHKDLHARDDSFLGCH